MQQSTKEPSTLRTRAFDIGSTSRRHGKKNNPPADGLMDLLLNKTENELGRYLTVDEECDSYEAYSLGWVAEDTRLKATTAALATGGEDE